MEISASTIQNQLGKIYLLRKIVQYDCFLSEQEYNADKAVDPEFIRQEITGKEINHSKDQKKKNENHKKR